MAVRSGQAIDGAAVATGSKEKSGGPKELRRVCIEVAKNGGFSVSVEYRPKPTKGKDNYPSYIEPEEYVFEDKAKMDAFTDKLFGVKADAGDE